MSPENGFIPVGDDFQFDPLAPAPSRPRYMKLIENQYVQSSAEYNAAKGTTKSVPQWRQVWEDHTFGPNDDGSMPIRFNNINLAWIRKEDTKAGKAGDLVKFGPDGLPTKLATAFYACGDVIINPQDDKSKQYIGHWFSCVRETVRMGPYEKTVWVPVEYHGTEIPQGLLDFQARQAGETVTVGVASAPENSDW